MDKQSLLRTHYCDLFEDGVSFSHFLHTEIKHTEREMSDTINTLLRLDFYITLFKLLYDAPLTEFKQTKNKDLAYMNESYSYLEIKVVPIGSNYTISKATGNIIISFPILLKLHFQQLNKLNDIKRYIEFNINNDSINYLTDIIYDIVFKYDKVISYIDQYKDKKSLLLKGFPINNINEILRLYNETDKKLLSKQINKLNVYTPYLISMLSKSSSIYYILEKVNINTICPYSMLYLLHEGLAINKYDFLKQYRKMKDLSVIYCCNDFYQPFMMTVFQKYLPKYHLRKLKYAFPIKDYLTEKV